MSIEAIRKALEKRLGTLAPALATAYENKDFAPVVGVPYQRVHLLPAAPDNTTLGDSYYREQGIFQVTLCYPINAGAGPIQARAGLLQAHFKRGTSMTEDGITTLITRTPAIAAGFQSGDRWCVPVSITYQAEIFS